MILDTNAVTALFEGDQALARRLASRDRHHLPVIVVGEYLFGVQGSRACGTLGRLLAMLVEQSEILAIDSDTARAYAEVRHQLKKDGRPIPENDVWIAALARQHDLPIVSRDRHFDHVKGIRRVEW